MSAVAAAVISRGMIVDLDVDLIDVADNIRVDPGELEGLAASIKSEGLAQPVKAIGPHEDGRYRLLYGQRRLLATRLAGLPTIATIVEATSDVDAPGPRRSIVQLVENLQRADLNPIDEAKALRDVLNSDESLTQQGLADKIGRSQSWVANTLGLLDAPEPIQDTIRTGELTAAHAKALKGLAPTTQVALAKEAIERGYSAHRTEEAVQNMKRSEEYRKEQESRQREAAKARQAQQLAVIGNFEKRKVGKSDRILVEKGYYGDGNAGHVADLIRKAGYTNVAIETQVSARPTDVPCDCVAWRVAVNYEARISLGPACINTAHQQAKEKVNSDRTADKERVMRDVQAAIADVLPGQLAAQPLTPLAARIVLWLTLDYQVADWAEQHGGKRSKPWDAIAALPDDQLPGEVAKAIAKGFRDRYGYHIDWAALGASLADSPAVEPETATPVKATRTARVVRATDNPMCSCGAPKVEAGHARWVCTNPEHPAGAK